MDTKLKRATEVSIPIPLLTEPTIFKIVSLAAEINCPIKIGSPTLNRTGNVWLEAIGYLHLTMGP